MASEPATRRYVASRAEIVSVTASPIDVRIAYLPAGFSASVRMAALADVITKDAEQDNIKASDHAHINPVGMICLWPSRFMTEESAIGMTCSPTGSSVGRHR